MQVVLLRGAEADLLELYVRAEEKQIGAGDRLYGMVDGAPSLTSARTLRSRPFTAVSTVVSC